MKKILMVGIFLALSPSLSYGVKLPSKDVLRERLIAHKTSEALHDPIIQQFAGQDQGVLELVQNIHTTIRGVYKNFDNPLMSILFELYTSGLIDVLLEDNPIAREKAYDCLTTYSHNSVSSKHLSSRL